MLEKFEKYLVILISWMRHPVNRCLSAFSVSEAHEKGTESTPENIIKFMDTECRGRRNTGFSLPFMNTAFEDDELDNKISKYNFIGLVEKF
eukprot:UN03884